MAFWRVLDRPDLEQIWFARILKPNTVPANSLMWLDDDPPDLDASGMIGKYDYGSSLVQPLVFTTNLPTSHADVYLGNSETFGPHSIAVSGGTPPYSYQWKRGTANVGSNSPTFGPATVDSVFPANGIFNWSCVVTDADGTVITSNIMPVTAYRLPSFTTQPPETLSVAAGALLEIKTTPANSSKAPRTYQWYKDGAPISGATSSNYTKAAAVAEDAGTYYLIFNDANGKQVQSNNCVLTIT